VAFEATLEMLRSRDNMLFQFLNNVFDSAIMLDTDGFIINCGTAAAQLTMHDNASMIGLHITEFDRVSPFEEVIRTQKPRINLLTIIQGRRCLQSIYPVFQQGELIGVLAFANYRNIDSLRQQIIGFSGREKHNAEHDQKILANLRRNYIFEDYIGKSPAVMELIRECRQAADTRYPILLLGESGTGKEILASAIHSWSMMGGKNKPYIKINCAAIPNDLLETELFGHERGAFTGATATKKGKLEAAFGGSVLLDEIGDMDPRLQAKLLRVLEEGEFERVGGVQTIMMDARVIASTNCDLRTRCLEGKFREDLFYRLSAITIRVPPLREHPEDIPLLTAHFVDSGDFNIAISENAMAAMMAYSWPGNTRELRNLITRFGVSLEGRSVTKEDVLRYLDPHIGPHSHPASLAEVSVQRASSAPRTLEQGEADLIRETLERCRYNITLSADSLGITRKTLYAKMKKYGLSA
jgi:transcriptional regulator with PAS, ATPase and Fis domain